MSHRSTVLRVVLFVCLGALVFGGFLGCSAIVGIDDVHPLGPDAGLPHDSGLPDSHVADGGTTHDGALPLTDGGAVDSAVPFDASAISLLAFTPNNHDFGMEPMTEGSPEFVFTVQNIGGVATGALSLAVTTMAGETASYAAGPTNTCMTSGLGPGAMCQYGVIFTPASASPYGGTLTATAATTTATAELSGTGVSGSPTGSQIYGVAGALVWGVTSDGYAIITDGTGAASAVNISSGALVPLVPASSPVAYIFVQGTSAMIWSKLTSTAPFIGTLNVFSNGALAPTAATGSVYGVGGVANGAAYFVTSMANGSGNLVWAPLGSLNMPGQAITGIYSDQTVGTNCNPQIVVRGTVVVAQYCLASTGANGLLTLATVNGSGVAHTLDQGVLPNWTIATDGSSVIAIDGGTADLYDTSTGQSFSTGANVTAIGVSEIGAGTIYAVENGALVAFNPQNLQQTTLVASSVGDLWTSLQGQAFVSPDGAHILYSSMPFSAGAGDLWTSPTVAGSTGTKIGAGVAVVGFSANSQFVGYLTNLNASTVETGELWLAPAAGGASMMLAANSAIQAIGTTAAAYNANFAMNSTNGIGTADLYAISQTTATTTLVAAKAGVLFALDPTNSKIVYATDFGGAPGIYVAPLPQ